MPMVRQHLREHTEPGQGGAAVPRPARASTWHRRRCTRSGTRPVEPPVDRDLRWHDLRHTGAVLAAQTGATLAELMGRLGHTTPGAALRYQHAAQGRDAEIARRLSALYETHLESAH